MRTLTWPILSCRASELSMIFAGAIVAAVTCVLGLASGAGA